MIIATGTKNPTKVEGIRRAFSRYFSNLEIRTIDTSTVVLAQPISLREIMLGAIKRAKLALDTFESNFGVGVEAGIFRLGNNYIEHQQAVIMNSKGKFSIGHSSGFMLPKGLVHRMIKEKRELEFYAEELTNVKNIGDKEGIVYHLTKRTIRRVDLTEQCVMMALVPWLNRDLYNY